MRIRSLSSFTLVLLLTCDLTYATGQDRRVEVGVFTALTGGMATIGTAVRNGVELARKERPMLFSNINFTYEDDQFDPKQSIAAYRRLKSERHVDIILGFGTLLAQSIGPLVERDGTPLINFNFEAAPIVGRHFIVRSVNHTDQYMETLARYLKSKHISDFPVVQAEATFIF